jgi:nucleoside phosphorylase/CheY-like chemotaxis protein
MAVLPLGSIRVLIVEDDTHKLGMIVKAIQSLDDAALVTYVDVRDAMSARHRLLKERFDLLILDLRIPNRLGELAEATEGANLLREITSRSKYQRPYHIIGITAFDDSFKNFESLFADQLWVLLKFDQTSDGWSRQLVNKLKYLLASKESLRYSDGETYEVDLAIITALDTVEFEAITRLQGPWEEFAVPHDSTRYVRTTFSSGNKKMSVVAAAAPRMGMSMSAVLASKLIHNFRPKYLCMCGIAAGLEDKTSIGDILAPDPSWDWGSGKREINKDKRPVFSPAPYQLPLVADVRDRLKAFALRNNVLADIQAKWPGPKFTHGLRLHVGPLASGAAVLADVEVVDSVKAQQRQLVGIEMEIYGVLTAAENCGKPRPVAFALKSVCDFGNENKSSEHQAYAAFTSAEFMYRFVLEELADG